MLILTRRPGERLCIGDDIVITILAVRGNQTRLGIAAPRDVAIDREEIHLRKLADRRTALEAGNESGVQVAAET